MFKKNTLGEEEKYLVPGVLWKAVKLKTWRDPNYLLFLKDQLMVFKTCHTNIKAALF